jgi:hypothetical protein
MISAERRPKWILGLTFVFLLFPFSALVGNNMGVHLEIANSGGLSAGDYARYTESNISLAYLAGYQPYRGLGYSNNTVWYNDYKTHLPYSSLTMEWQIESVEPNSYVVNYTVTMKGLERGGANGDRVVENVIVSRQNNTVYSTNSTVLGTWPYWLDSKYLAPGSMLTLIHDFPEFVSNGTFTGLEHFTETAFTSLPQGTAEPNKTATEDFLDSSLDLGPQGTFDTDRLLVTYPFFRAVSLPGAGTGVTYTYANSIWIGVYDRPSGILLAQDHDFWFIDDILLHSGSGIGQIGFSGLSLVLSSTNLNLSPDSRPGGSDLWILAAVMAGLIAVFGVATLMVVRRRSGAARR